MVLPEFGLVHDFCAAIFSEEDDLGRIQVARDCRCSHDGGAQQEAGKKGGNIHFEGWKVLTVELRSFNGIERERLRLDGFSKALMRSWRLHILFLRGDVPNLFLEIIYSLIIQPTWKTFAPSR